MDRMIVWMIEVVSTDGYNCTEGPFISSEYVMTSDQWTFSELQWKHHSSYDEEEPVYYAEDNVNGVITGYVMYSLEVAGS